MKELEPYEERNVANSMRRCVHFNGIMDLSIDAPKDEDRKCAAGVSYASVTGNVADPNASLLSKPIPCFADRDAGSLPCAARKFMTREEAVADWLDDKARISEYFAKIRAGECPNHKRKVELRQVGSCVYGDCGCRMYQGKLPRAARKLVGGGE